MIKEIIARLVDGKDLSEDECVGAMKHAIGPRRAEELIDSGDASKHLKKLVEAS